MCAHAAHTTPSPATSKCRLERVFAKACHLKQRLSRESLARQAKEAQPQASRNIDAEAGGSGVRRLWGGDCLSANRRTAKSRPAAEAPPPRGHNSQALKQPHASCTQRVTPFETHFSPPPGRPRMLFQPVGHFSTVPSVMAPANPTPGYHVQGTHLAVAFVSPPNS